MFWKRQKQAGRGLWPMGISDLAKGEENKDSGDIGLLQDIHRQSLKFSKMDL